MKTIDLGGELEFCPFCGTMVNLVVEDGMIYSYVRVECPNCGAKSLKRHFGYEFVRKLEQDEKAERY